jgi:SAM-dependent methyltransferase
VKKFDAEKFREMVRSHWRQDDPLGWFERIYQHAEGDHTAVFWADLHPNPYLTEWLESHPPADDHKRAIAIGCGVGDDAEAMASYGYDVVAFDISPSAIELCKKRYPHTTVEYLVADLFVYPREWKGAFDLVYECNTIQVLPGIYRERAIKAMAELVAPGGDILVSCRSRKKGKDTNAIPLPLDHEEMNSFKRHGLQEQSFLSYSDEQVPPVPHFFATYRKMREGYLRL